MRAVRRLQQLEGIRRTVACLLVLAACSPAPAPSASFAPHETKEDGAPPPGSAAAEPQAAPSPPAPLPEPSAGAGESPTRVELEVPGFLPAVVVVPPKTERPAPLVVALHGAGGRPEPHCDRYRELTGGRAFVLCTRGTPNNKHLPEEERGYFYDGHHRLGQEVLAAMDALAARFPDRVDVGGAVFAGYSQGASMGLLFLHEKAEHAARFRRALFVEGGFADWNIALSERMKASGLGRVAIVCGQVKCKTAGDKSLGYLKRAGLEARLSYDSRGGHTYGGAVAPLVESALDWLVEDDARFGSLAGR